MKSGKLQLIKEYLNLRMLLTSISFMIGVILLNVVVNLKTLMYISSITLLAVPLAFLALAELIVFIAGEVDMSVGAGLTLANVIPVYAYLYHGIEDYRFILLHIVVGLSIGLVNGTLVGLLRINSFLATLATSSIWAGLSLTILNKPEGPIPTWYYRLFMDGLLGVPMVIIGMLVAISMWMVFRFSKTSLHFYAVGSSSYAAFIAGINVNVIKFIAFILNGLFIGLAAIFMTGIIASGDPTIGLPYTLSAILAAIIGGARFTGGAGDGIATISAAVGLTFMRNLIFSLGVPFYQQDLVYSIVVLALLAIAMYLRGVK
jgi:ribose transport system permease protein